MAVKVPFYKRVKQALDLVWNSPPRKTRSFSMSSVSRLTEDWMTGTMSADSALRRNLRVMRNRSRDLVDDNDFAQKYIKMVLANVLGHAGIDMRCKAKDPDTIVANKIVPGQLDIGANKTIETNWWEWGKKSTCAVTRNLSWKDVQDVCLESVARDGECIVRKVRGANNKWGFALQLIESDLLDIEYNVSDVNGGGQIRMGVEVDIMGAPVAYHLWTKHPDDTYFTNAQNQQRVRVRADDIIHPYITRRIGQTRGYPWLATSAFGLKMLGGYSVAEVTKARLVAAKMAFFKRTGDRQYEGEPIEDGKVMDVEPGLMEQLPDGVDVQSIDWNSPNMNYADFVKAQLRQMASGLGVFYANLGNDHESVNFSSSRVGLQDERDTWKRLQEWFSESFCSEVFSAWLETSLIKGALGSLPFSKFYKFNAPLWQGRRWEWVDPTKEVSAIISAINAGLASISGVLAERGIDRDELFDQIAEDKKAMEDRGISFSEVLHEPPPDPLELAEAEAKAKPAPKAQDRELDQPQTQTPIINVAPNISVKTQAAGPQTRHSIKIMRDENGDIQELVRIEKEEPRTRGIKVLRDADGHITEYQPTYEQLANEFASPV